MLEKILERLREKSNEWFERWAGSGSEDEYADGRSDSFDEAIVIVQEVAKEYGKDTNVRSNGWIPCSERLPDTYDNLLICQSNGYVGVGYSTLKEFRDLNSYPYDDVIAWQPLPAPYQKGE